MSLSERTEILSKKFLFPKYYDMNTDLHKVGHNYLPLCNHYLKVKISISYIYIGISCTVHKIDDRTYISLVGKINGRDGFGKRLGF
jgi:hypothetical protein